MCNVCDVDILRVCCFLWTFACMYRNIFEWLTINSTSESGASKHSPKNVGFLWLNVRTLDIINANIPILSNTHPVYIVMHIIVCILFVICNQTVWVCVMCCVVNYNSLASTHFSRRLWFDKCDKASSIHPFIHYLCMNYFNTIYFFSLCRFPLHCSHFHHITSIHPYTLSANFVTQSWHFCDTLTTRDETSTNSL